MTTRTHKTQIIVNGDLLGRAISRKRLSTRDVARRSGITFNILNRMLRNNEFAANLPIRILHDLAELTDMTIAELLTLDTPPRDTPPPTPEQTADTPTSDMQRLANLLALNTGSPRPESIALAFGWTLPRLAAARYALDAYLKPAGLRAVRANDSVYLTTNPEYARRHETDNDLAAVYIAESADKPINITMARLLDDALNGETKNVHTNNETVKLGEAVNVGTLTRSKNTDIEPSEMFKSAFPDM